MALRSHSGAWVVMQSGAASPRLAAALAAIGAAAAIVDEDGRVIEANAEARELLASGIGLPSIPVESRTAPQGEPHWTVRPVETPPEDAREYLLVRRADGELLLKAQVGVAADRWSLTRRQREVLGMLVEGQSNLAIGAALAISLRTVEVHVTALLEKAHCVSRSALAARVFTLR